MLMLRLEFGVMVKVFNGKMVNYCHFEYETFSSNAYLSKEDINIKVING